MFQSTRLVSQITTSQSQPTSGTSQMPVVQSAGPVSQFTAYSTAQETLRRWERSAKGSTFIYSHAAGLAKVLDSNATQLKVI